MSINYFSWNCNIDFVLICVYMPVGGMRVCLPMLVCVCGYVYQSRQLESESGTTEEHSLNKEARKWATRVAREHKNIIHCKRVRAKMLQT